MDSKTLLAVVVTALIVAVLTSLITVKLTGNIINVPTVYPSPTNYTQVYTKAEVDSSLRNIFLKRVNLTIGNINGNLKGDLSDRNLQLSPMNLMLNTSFKSLIRGAESENLYGGIDLGYWGIYTISQRGNWTNRISLWRDLISNEREFFGQWGLGGVPTLVNRTLLTPDGIVFEVFDATGSPSAKNYQYICAPDFTGKFGCKTYSR
ncbi:MAG: hypothetical protein AABW75_01205 [Nanoarchaeota archaeon]